jgi:hypothetical protein
MDPTVWLDRARPTPMSLIMSLTNSLLDKLSTYAEKYAKAFVFGKCFGLVL